MPQEPGVEGQAVEKPERNGKQESANTRSVQCSKKLRPKNRGQPEEDPRHHHREHASHDRASHDRLPGERGSPRTIPGAGLLPQSVDGGLGLRGLPLGRGAVGQGKVSVLPTGTHCDIAGADITTDRPLENVYVFSGHLS